MFKKISRSQVRRIFVVTMIALVAVMGSLSLIRTQALTNTVKIQIDKGGGTDNTQETTFNFLVKNVTTTAVSGISARVYFTPDGSNAASGYALEKYYDQSGVATVSGPTLFSGTTYYFTVNYGTASLAAGAQWEFQTALHLSSWASTYNGGNDYYHTGYAVGALPAAYTDTNYITAYTSGTLAWGTEPGGTTLTNTFVPPTTVVPPPTTAVPTTPAGGLPELEVTSIAPAPSTVPCGSGWNPGTFVTVVNNGPVAAGSFVLTLKNAGAVVATQTISGIAANDLTTLRFPINGGQFTAIADSTNVVTESDETDNSFSQTLPVSDQIPCSPTPGTPTKTFTPSATPTFVSGDTFLEGYVSAITACGGTAAVPGAPIFFMQRQVATTDNTGHYFVDVGNINATQGQLIQVTSVVNSLTGFANAYTVTGGNHAFMNIPLNAPNPSPTPLKCSATPTGTPAPLTLTPTPSSTDIIIHGTVTQPQSCQQVPAISSIYVSVNGKPSTFAARTDSTGAYTANIGNLGGQAATILVSTDYQTSPALAMSPQYVLWTHAGGTSENKTLNFSVVASGTPTPSCTTVTVSPTPSGDFGNITLSGTVTKMGNPDSGETVNASTSGPHGSATGSAITAADGSYSLVIHVFDTDTVSVTVKPRVDYNPITITRSGSATFTNRVFNFAFSGPTITPTPKPTIPSDLTPTPTNTPTIVSCNTPTCSVSIVDFAFSPSSISYSINLPTITWTNNGTVNHTITADDGSFDSGPLAPGQTFSIKAPPSTKTYHCSIHTSMKGTLIFMSDIPTPTPSKTLTVTVTRTPITPTPTPTATATATKSNTPSTSTKTVTPTTTNTVVASNTPGGTDPCASPTVITGGGTFSVTTATTCFKYVNTSFVNGGMFSVMKDGTSASDTVKWYGGMDQNTTACTNQSGTVSGNGGQLNNFTVAKDTNGQMYLIVTGSASNSITLSIQNWQNGAGCSVKPTVHP